jgi:hypothetical protein
MAQEKVRIPHSLIGTLGNINHKMRRLKRRKKRRLRPKAGKKNRLRLMMKMKMNTSMTGKV